MALICRAHHAVISAIVSCFAACSVNRFFPENYFQLFRANLHYTGRVRWWFGGVMETSCHIEGTLFPFDSQSCSIILQSWAYSQGFVDLNNTSDEIHLEDFEDNGNKCTVYVLTVFLKT